MKNNGFSQDASDQLEISLAYRFHNKYKGEEAVNL